MSLSGDGETNFAGLTLSFDGELLLLPITTGTIPGAAANGALCNRSGRNHINILVMSPEETVLPAGPLPMCKLSFKLAKPQSRGRAALTAVNPECFARSAPARVCTASSGAVSVLGQAGTPLPPSPIAERQVHVLLSADAGAPTADQLASFDFSSSRPRPLAGLDVEAPFDVETLIYPRANGDFQRYLQSYPGTARAKLERYAVVRYKPSADIQRALTALRAERFVALAYAIQPGAEIQPKAAVNRPAVFDAQTQSDAQPAPQQFSPLAKSTTNQPHLSELGIPALWERAGGWALVGAVDSGLEINHPNLRSFSGAGSLSGSYLSGNFMPVYSYDFRYSVDDVDERRRVPVQVSPNPDLTALYQECDLLDGIDDDLMRPTAVGHGTHVSGLLAAKGTAGNDALGICKRCGIGMAKITQYQCLAEMPRIVTSEPVPTRAINALGYFNGIGVQVINLSFGIRGIFQYEGNCQTPPPDSSFPPNSQTAVCLALQFSAENDVLVVGASGNNRDVIQFPAEDPRVVAVGGLGVAFSLWDDSPGSTEFCPRTPDGSDCGSNFTAIAGGRKQELVVPAKSVRSTMYTGSNYNEVINCGDSFGGLPTDTPNDGQGTCTGTSMSAPQMAGILGVLRSINPLLVGGDPESTVQFGCAICWRIAPSKLRVTRAGSHLWLRPPSAQCCGGYRTGHRARQRAAESANTAVWPL
ncbi:S8 family serine peptidase [bacterium]|nr:S8 family serine peptidase [bacterium]